MTSVDRPRAPSGTFGGTGGGPAPADGDGPASLALDDLARAVAALGPQRADPWETTALLESLGLTDRVISQEMGFPAARELGAHVHGLIVESALHAAPTPPSSPRSHRQVAGREVRDFVSQFSRSFIYAVPWIALFFGEVIRPRSVAALPADAAAALALAIMGSLVTSGGFIQLIVRRGQFYLNLREPSLARRSTARFARLGLLCAILVAFLGVLFGFYRGLFGDAVILLAATNYLLLTVLWLSCAALCAQDRPLRLPMVFLFGGLLHAVLRHVAVDAVAAQVGVAAGTAAGALALAAWGFRAPPGAAIAEEMELPPLKTLLGLLAPYFAYGMAYFSFLFADRLVAGTAVAGATGLSFAIEPAYKRPMDLAFVAFLPCAALAEYFNYKLMRFWHDEARVTPSSRAPLLARRLRRRHLAFTVALVGAFGALAGGACCAVQALSPGWLDAVMVRTMLVGATGYAFLIVGVLNSLVLFSLARPTEVVGALVPGLALDLAAGYLLAHLVGIPWAAVGLAAGALVHALLTSRAVDLALRHADHAYYAA